MHCLLCVNQRFILVQGAESLRPLVIQALAFVPKSKQNSTPITLKATAGLRLLSEGVADNILNEVS